VNAEYFRSLFEYRIWAREKLLGAADGITDEELWRENGFNYHSIGGILTHLFLAERGWSARFRGERPEGRPDWKPSLQELRQEWAGEDAQLRQYLASLSDSDLQRILPSRAGEFPLWQGMSHDVNHSAQHRSEAAEALTMVGRSPGDLDMLNFYNPR
jgi:uncharacterized damage-inducible protein DinB